MMGKELEGLSFKELQHLEHQLNEGILSVKDKKVINARSLINSSTYSFIVSFRGTYLIV